MAVSKKQSVAFEQADSETKLRPDGEWTKRVNVDIPVWAIKDLDKESSRRGITRQALIKTWLIDRLDQMRAEHQRSVG